MTTLSTRMGRGLGAAALAVALLGACGDDASDDTADTTTSTVADPADAIEITGAWARTSPAVATAGAVYMTISNSAEVDDALLGASVDASVAATVELHETVEGEPMGSTTTGMDGGMGGGTDGGMMTMQPVDEIAVPAGDAAVLEPGGFHIMLLDLATPLEVGTTVTVTLTFEQAGEIEVTADVLDTAP